MEVKTIEDKNQIDNFILAQSLKSGSFLQFYFWGEFQNQYGFKIWRLGVFNQEVLQGIALIIKHPLPVGKSYLYCPKGPVFKRSEKLAVGSRKQEARGEMYTLIFERIKEIAQAENAILFRFEPPVSTEQFSGLPETLGIKKVSSVQPQTTWVLNLKTSEEEILSQMKQKTRYNIRLAEKKKVHIRTSGNPKEAEQFFSLAKETAQRNRIRTHPKKYYNKMMESLSPHNLVKFYIAEYRNKALAINLMLSFGDTVTYLHGGSTYEHRNVMASYLLHWQAIKDAKQEGKSYYDFGGVSPEEETGHKWAGISRFKRGFGGTEVNSAGTFEKVLSPGWYWLYRIVRGVRNR